MGFVIRATLLALMLSTSTLPALARQATPLPETPPSCTGTKLPPGTPVPIFEIIASGTQSPEAEATAPRITRIAADIPAPPPPHEAVAPAGSPADPETTQQVTAAVENLFGCLTLADYLAFAALVTPDYRTAAFGTENQYNAVMPLEGYPEVEIRTVEDVHSLPDGRKSADVTIVFADTQAYRFRAVFIEDRGSLLLDEEIPLPFDNADATVAITLDSSGLSAEPGMAPSGSLVAFDVSNGLDEDLEFRMIRIPGSLAGTDPQEDPAVISRSVAIGGVMVGAGARESFAVADVQPGSYLIVAFSENADGDTIMPGNAVATFEIE